MGFFEIIGFVLLIGILILLFGGQRLSEWVGSRMAGRALEPDTEPQVHLVPEGDFIIRMNEAELSYHRPDGLVESVRWDDLERVEVLTTSDGPLLPDVFWLLHGSAGNGGCVIPQGATGDGELLKRLQELPRFDNKAFINAMGSTQPALFVCWEKIDCPPNL